MRTVDDAKRKELLGEVQQRLWDNGGYVIWGFAKYISGASKKSTASSRT